MYRIVQSSQGPWPTLDVVTDDADSRALVLQGVHVVILTALSGTG